MEAKEAKSFIPLNGASCLQRKTTLPRVPSQLFHSPKRGVMSATLVLYRNLPFLSES